MNMHGLADHMNVVSAATMVTIEAGRKSGLSKDAAVLAALIGVLSYIRVDGLNEEAILQEARRAVPGHDPSNALAHVALQ